MHSIRDLASVTKEKENTRGLSAVILKDADHNDAELTAGPAVIQAVADFLSGR